MMFTVALYLPMCRYLEERDGVQPQLYAVNLKCVSRILMYCLMLPGSPLGMYGWLGRSLRQNMRVDEYTSGHEELDLLSGTGLVDRYFGH